MNRGISCISWFPKLIAFSRQLKLPANDILLLIAKRVIDFVNHRPGFETYFNIQLVYSVITVVAI